MNPSTLVSVHCYKGDEERVKGFLPYYLHHKCPVAIMSPEDSRVEFGSKLFISGETEIGFFHAGKRAYIGQESLDRQIEHLKILLALDNPRSDFFLLNDSDSLCLTPEIPPYVYTEPVLWSNEVIDPRTHPTNLPRLALQPPYFCSRNVLTWLVNAAPKVTMHPITPYVDHFMLQLCHAAGVTHKPFENPTFAHPVKTVEGIQRFRDALK